MRVGAGIKLAQAYAEFHRARGRLQYAHAEIATCAISGAVGTFANIDPAVEAHVADKLGLSPIQVYSVISFYHFFTTNLIMNNSRFT